MKKIIALLLAMTMVFALCACGSKTEAPAEETPADATEETPADAAEAPAEETAASDIKVGFIFLHDENSTYDLNFINAANEVREALGFTEEQFIYKTNVPEGEQCYEAAAELADMGCSIVFADSFGHEGYMIEAAKEFPEVQFCHATGNRAHTEGLDNFHNAFASIYEGRYLAGIAAGMKLNEMIEAGEFTAEEAKIGYIGAYTYAEVVSGYTSFLLGARSVCPTATMEVTFTGSWYDEALEKEAANKLIGNGCKLISQHADSMGAPTACETAGVPNVSYNGSTKEACPNTYIVSSRINWAPYFEFAINAVMNGEEIPSDWVGTIATDSVLLTEINTDAAAEGTVEAIEAAKAALIDGSVKVFDLSTFTVEGKAVESFMADVEADADNTGDTEVVIDGAIAESHFRSAPYFSLNIDGITLLDTAF